MPGVWPNHASSSTRWMSTRRVVTGTYAQCEQALAAAQRHNLSLGWWSMASVLLFNWIALYRNTTARSELRRLAGAGHPHPAVAPPRQPVPPMPQPYQYPVPARTGRW